MSLRSLLSPSRRLAPMPFSISAVVVYLASFGSQVLLSPPTTGRLGVAPFVAAQAVLIAIWYVLHTRRLHDAGRPAGLAVGIAIVYAIEVVLLSIVVWLILASTVATADGIGTESSLLKFMIIISLLTLLTGDPTLGVLHYWLIGFVVLMFVPVAIALGFSLWAATRPSRPS